MSAGRKVLPTSQGSVGVVSEPVGLPTTGERTRRMKRLHRPRLFSPTCGHCLVTDVVRDGSDGVHRGSCPPRRPRAQGVGGPSRTEGLCRTPPHMSHPEDRDRGKGVGGRGPRTPWRSMGCGEDGGRTSFLISSILGCRSRHPSPDPDGFLPRGDGEVGGHPRG